MESIQITITVPHVEALLDLATRLAAGEPIPYTVTAKGKKNKGKKKEKEEKPPKEPKDDPYSEWASPPPSEPKPQAEAKEPEPEPEPQVQVEEKEQEKEPKPNAPLKGIIETPPDLNKKSLFKALQTAMLGEPGLSKCIEKALQVDFSVRNINELSEDMYGSFIAAVNRRWVELT